MQQRGDVISRPSDVSWSQHHKPFSGLVHSSRQLQWQLQVPAKRAAQKGTEADEQTGASTATLPPLQQGKWEAKKKGTQGGEDEDDDEGARLGALMGYEGDGGTGSEGSPGEENVAREAQPAGTSRQDFNSTHQQRASIHFCENTLPLFAGSEPRLDGGTLPAIRRDALVRPLRAGHGWLCHVVSHEKVCLFSRPLPFLSPSFPLPFAPHGGQHSLMGQSLALLAQVPQYLRPTQHVRCSLLRSRTANCHNHPSLHSRPASPRHTAKRHARTPTFTAAMGRVLQAMQGDHLWAVPLRPIPTPHP